MDIADPATLDAVIRIYGVMTELSTSDNPEPLLFINGTMSNSNSMVQCVALGVNNSLNRCEGIQVSVIFYGKR